jgi:type IV secretion system protein VirD4
LTRQRLYALLSSIFARPALWKQIVDDLLAFPDMEVRRIAGEIEYKRKEAQGEFSGITGKLFEALCVHLGPGLVALPARRGFLPVGRSPARRPATDVPDRAGGLHAALRALHAAHDRGGHALQGIRKPQHAAAWGSCWMRRRNSATLKCSRLAFSYMRGGGVRTWAFFQSVGQLVELYGQARGGQSLMESAQLRQFFGVGHYDTARLVSDMLGVETAFYDDPLYQTPHQHQAMNALLYGGMTTQALLTAAGHIALSGMKSTTQRPLMHPDEVLRLGPDQQVCFVSGKTPSLKPVLAGRRPYYTRPDFAGAYLPNPNHPPFDRVKVASRFGWSWTWKVWSHEVLPHLAGLPQYQQGMMSYAARFPLLAASRASGGVLGGSVGRGVGESSSPGIEAPPWPSLARPDGSQPQGRAFFPANPFFFPTARAVVKVPLCGLP